MARRQTARVFQQRIEKFLNLKGRVNDAKRVFNRSGKTAK